MPTKIRSNPAPKHPHAQSGVEGARPRSDAPSNSSDLPSVLAKLESTRKELDALYGQLERLNRLGAMGTIAGMIAHEFNNILTPMLSYAQMALAAPDDRELVEKALNRTVAGSERAAKIADAILNFVRDEDPDAKLTAFHVEHPPEPINPAANIAAVVADALTCTARDPARDGVDLRLSIPPSLNAAIQPIALQQVLVNLLQNARNALGSKGGRIDITASRWSKPPETPERALDSRTAPSPFDTVDNQPPSIATSTRRSCHWVTIAIHDFGCGMRPSQLADLFTPFRSRSSGDRRGTGLGMVITKRLVESAGGWITVESVHHVGTTMTVVLALSATNF